VVRGEKNVERLILAVASRARKSICSYADSNAPSVIIELRENYDHIRDLHARGVRIRYITEVTKENAHYCARMMAELSAEVRHIDGVRGNFTVTDTEYISIPQRPKGGKIPRELIYSNLPELVEQNQFFFETLWSSSVPAEDRIRELQDGKPRYGTRMIRDQYDVLNETIRMVENSNEYSVSSVSGGLLYAYTYSFDTFKEILDKHRAGQHKGIRWLTTINEDAVEAAKKFLDLGMEIRHTGNIPTESFGISDKEVGVTLSRLEGGRLNNRALFSNEPIYLEHYGSLFEELWVNATDARERIRQIEEGIEEPLMKIIRNRQEVQRVYLQLINQAKDEILLLLPTTNTYLREEEIGVIEAMQSAVADRGVKVLMLSPDSSAKDGVQKFNKGQGTKQEGRINYKSIRAAKGPHTVTILVVDRKESLIIELSDDSKLAFDKAIGLATYSNRGSTVKSNIRFFERMWEESEAREREERLLQKEIRSRREAQLLQDILAHDIRNFNQISLTSAELLKNEYATPEALPLIEEILSATERSSNLIERAKNLGKIISQQEVKLSPIDLGESLRRSIDLVSKAHREKKVNTTVALKSRALVVADEFLDEVFTNILSNAVNYTEGQDVPLDISIEEAVGSDENHVGKLYYRISFADHGRGIPDQVKPRVFTRYLETARGSGLGLSIVYALVVDRYSGRVEVRNRVEGDYQQGTVIEVWLPKAP